ncbi:unnamed protein product [Pleuronectes platessa]|uniref:Uncharacterized protein n=1 Tax=Pleuronectes platessa TaxID=8262 RepID=A0A9N7Y3M5_PLEPL|nr:unnamed protein product [Pleuronectes platessa]
MELAEMNKEQRWRQRDRREKVGQTAALQPLLSALPLRGSEGGHPHLRALNQPAADLACPGYIARSLCLSACDAAISLQPVPGYTATGTEHFTLDSLICNSDPGLITVIVRRETRESDTIDHCLCGSACVQAPSSLFSLTLPVSVLVCERWVCGVLVIRHPSSRPSTRKPDWRAGRGADKRRPEIERRVTAAGYCCKTDRQERCNWMAGVQRRSQASGLSSRVRGTQSEATKQVGRQMKAGK